MDDIYSQTACCFLFIFRNISRLWLYIHLFIKYFVCFIEFFKVFMRRRFTYLLCAILYLFENISLTPLFVTKYYWSYILDF
jgi:hypothetical protein